MVSCRMNILALYTIMCLVTVYGADENHIATPNVNTTEEEVCSTTTDNQISTPIVSTTEVVVAPGTTESITEALVLPPMTENDIVTPIVNTTEAEIAPTTIENHKAIPIVSRTEGVVAPTTTKNHIATPVLSTTEAVVLPPMTENHIVTPIVNTTEAVIPPATTANHKATPIVTTTKTVILPHMTENHIVKPIVNTTEAEVAPTTTENHNATLTVSTTEAVVVLPTTDIHTTRTVVNTSEAKVAPTTTVNRKATPIVSTTEVVVAPITTEKDTVYTTEAVVVRTTTENHTATTIISITEADDVPKSNITGVKETRPTVCEEYNPTAYDVNIIFMNENNLQNGLRTTSEATIRQNKILLCEYAEMVCLDNGKSEDDNLSEVKNVTYDTHFYNYPEELKIEISRDESSAVQPLFTSYFPKLANDSTTNFYDNYSDQQIMGALCSIKKGSNCNQNMDSLKHINIYLKTNYVENNTITMYPNCNKDSITSENELSVKCEDVSFAKHNQHILQAPPKKELWNCQITEFKNTLPSTEQRTENSKIHFINCSNNTKPVSTEINSENIVTIRIAEKPNDCSHKSNFNINEGKIIDLGLNNKEKILQNNNIDLTLSNCMSDHYSIIKNKEPPPETELIIILKNEPLNASNLNRFNGTVKKENVKQRILLLCGDTNLDLSSNTASTKTELQCESINLNLHNITGMEIVHSTYITNNGTAIKLKSMSNLSTWNCLISEEKHNNKLHFENCSNGLNINYSKNLLEKNNVLSDFDSDKRNIEISKPKDDINTTIITSGNLEQNQDYLSKLKHVITISITEKESNCTNISLLNIDKGNIIVLGGNNNKEEILQNNKVELKVSDCINHKPSMINKAKTDSMVDLTIILKSEALNVSDLQQLNGTPKDGNVKQIILLRCGQTNNNATNNKTILQCESIDLDLYNITGIEINKNKNQSSNLNNFNEMNNENLNNHKAIDSRTKSSAEINMTKNFGKNRTVEHSESTVGNKRNETKEVPKNISENNMIKEEYKEIHKSVSESNENLNYQIFYGRQDTFYDVRQDNLSPESVDTKKIVPLLSIAGGAILIVIVLKTCTKKKKNNPAPRRAPPDITETEF